MALPAYDLVVATHERPDALRVALPWMLAQDPPPARLIVVDSSTDGEAIERLAQDAVAGTGVPLRFVRAEPGLPHQRNVGLSHVESPIVFFPDDDAVLHPGAAEAILRVYERDTTATVGAVSGMDSRLPPAGFAQSVYRVDASARLRRLVGPVRYALERRFMPDVFVVHIRERWGSPQTPESPVWLAEVGARREGWMKGFRMTFRTEVIRSMGFDENLARYALFEDVDASFAVLEDHIVATADRAPIYHYSAPGRRGDPRTMGVMQILNRGYVVYKHSPPGSRARRALIRFGWYKIFLYCAALTSKAGRERLVGALAGMRALKQLERSSADRLGATYKRLFVRLTAVSS